MRRKVPGFVLLAEAVGERPKRFKRQPSAKPVFLYGLVCPLENRVVYVGQTVSPRVRLKDHIERSSNKDVRAWVERLRDAGSIPEMIILEVVEREGSIAREATWIAYFQKRGAVLNKSLVRYKPVRLAMRYYCLIVDGFIVGPRIRIRAYRPPADTEPQEDDVVPESELNDRQIRDAEIFHRMTWHQKDRIKRLIREKHRKERASCGVKVKRWVDPGFWYRHAIEHGAPPAFCRIPR